MPEMLLDVRRHRVRHTIRTQRAHHTQLLQRRLVLPLLRELLLLGTLALDELLPALGRALDVAVKVTELVHARQHLDATPAQVVEEVHRRGDVGIGGEAQQEVELLRVDGAAHHLDEERHLRGEDDLVAFEETACRVDEHRVRDAVDQVDDTLLHLLRLLGAVDGDVEDDAERFERELVHWMYLIYTLMYLH